MANLVFTYGAMGSGKSANLLLKADNYERNNKKVFLIKSIVDSKADNKVSSRVGLEREVDLLLGKEESLVNYFKYLNGIVDYIFVDEAQFMSESQIDELWYISKMFDIPVLCYGIRTDLRSEFFSGAKRLMELADSIKEISNMCECGNYAKFNTRYKDGKFTLEGESVVIDGSEENIDYKPMCGKCYLKKRLQYKR